MDSQPIEVDPLTKKILESEDVLPLAKKVVAHMKALGVESYDEATLGMLVEFVYRYVVETGDAAAEVADMFGRQEVILEDVIAALNARQRPKVTEEQMKDYAKRRNSQPLSDFPDAEPGNFTCQTTANGCTIMNSSKPAGEKK